MKNPMEPSGEKIAVLFPGVGYTCAERGIPLYITENANHSLETGAVEQDIRTLEQTIQKIRESI